MTTKNRDDVTWARRSRWRYSPLPFRLPRAAPRLGPGHTPAVNNHFALGIHRDLDVGGHLPHWPVASDATATTLVMAPMMIPPLSFGYLLARGSVAGLRELAAEGH